MGAGKSGAHAFMGLFFMPGSNWPPHMGCRRAVEETSSAAGGPSVKDLDDAVEAFMKRQAELESGGKEKVEVVAAVHTAAGTCVG